MDEKLRQEVETCTTDELEIIAAKGHTQQQFGSASCQNSE